MQLKTFNVAIMGLILLGLMIIGTGEFFAAADRTQLEYELQIEEIENETLPFMQ